MAACTWKVPITLPNYYQRENQTLFSHDPIFCSFGSKLRSESLNNCCLVVKQSKFMVRGCGCEDDYGETEEDKYFVKVLRESKPYLSIHRARVFVVLISAQIVAEADYFNAILKVPSLSLSLSKHNTTTSLAFSHCPFTTT